MSQLFFFFFDQNHVTTLNLDQVLTLSRRYFIQWELARISGSFLNFCNDDVILEYNNLSSYSPISPFLQITFGSWWMQDNEHADFDVFVLFTDCGLSILPKIFQVECQLGDEDPESVNHLNFSYNCLFHGLAFINLYFVNVLF